MPFLAVFRDSGPNNEGMPHESEYVNDGFRAWVDGASIQIKAVTAHGDPVDLGTEEVRNIIAALARMVRQIDGDDERPGPQ